MSQYRTVSIASGVRYPSSVLKVNCKEERLARQTLICFKPPKLEGNQFETINEDLILRLVWAKTGNSWVCSYFIWET